MTDCHIKVSHCMTHAFGLLNRKCVFVLRYLPMCKCAKVFCVISKNVCKLSHIVLAQCLVNLIVLKRFLEINSYLSGDFCQLVCRKARIATLSEEEILSLSQTEVAIHLKCLLCKVRR